MNEPSSSVGVVHSDFDVAFSDGLTLLDHDGMRLVTSVVTLGELPISSGALGVGDFFTGMSKTSPPSGVIARGSYPVDLSLVRFLDDGFCSAGDVRVAVARIRFSREQAVRWVLASDGAGVDSGTCGFIDGIEDYFGLSDEDGERLLGEFERASLGPSANGAEFHADGRVVFAFSSGLGDSLYDGYWGLDASGNVVAYCLDFDLLVRDITLDVELALPLGRGKIRHPALDEAKVVARVPWLDTSCVVVSSSGPRHAYARWKCGDRYLRPMTTWKGDSLEVRLDGRPSGGSLVLRIPRGREAMRPS